MSFLDKVKNHNAGRGAVILALIYIVLLLSLFGAAAAWYFSKF